MAIQTVPGWESIAGGLGASLWNRALVRKFNAGTCLREICDTSGEKQLTTGGVELIYNVVPTLTVRNYIQGEELVYERKLPTKVVLTPDIIKYIAFTENDIDHIQSFDKKYSQELMDQNMPVLKASVEEEVFEGVIADVDPANTGIAAGHKSGAFNVGSPDAPVTITKDTVLPLFTRMEGVLREWDIPVDGNQFVVVDNVGASFLKQSDLADASYTGDGTSILLNGRMDRPVSNLRPYFANSCYRDGDVVAWYFGHKKGTGYVVQWQKIEDTRKPETIETYWRSFFLCGFKVLIPQYVGVAYVTY